MKPTPEQITHIINAMARDFPDWDSPYPQRIIEHWESIRPKDQAAPEPLAFPDPPQGYSWHNGANLTPEQVGVSEGWRLCCKEEQCVLVDEIWENEDGKWSPSVMCPKVKYDYESFIGYTYRTKAPLPAPKLDEIERAEFEKWAFKSCISITAGKNHGYEEITTGAAWEAWQAAKKGLTAL